MVTLLAFNVKTTKSILKYFIAEESSNVTFFRRKNQLVQIPFRSSGSAAAKWVIWYLERPLIRFKIAATVGNSISKHRKDKANS